MHKQLDTESTKFKDNQIKKCNKKIFRGDPEV